VKNSLKVCEHQYFSTSSILCRAYESNQSTSSSNFRRLLRSSSTILNTINLISLVEDSYKYKDLKFCIGLRMNLKDHIEDHIVVGK